MHAQTLCCVWLFYDSMDCSMPDFPVLLLSSTFWLNSWPFSQWCCLTISSSATLFSFALNLPQHQDLFQWADSSSTFGHIRWPKFWSFGFTISFSNEYSRLISFSIDWFDLLVVQGTLKNLFSTMTWKHQFFSA